jgi:ribonuclease HII
MSLLPIYDESNKYEIGVDECARGPMFGRLYVAAAILPKDNSFRHELMKDSKKIKSRVKMRELSDYIKEHAIAWHIHFIEASVIDEKMDVPSRAEGYARVHQTGDA